MEVMPMSDANIFRARNKENLICISLLRWPLSEVSRLYLSYLLERTYIVCKKKVSQNEDSIILYSFSVLAPEKIGCLHLTDAQ